MTWRSASLLGSFVDDPAFGDHETPVGQLENLVEVFGDQQHRGSAVTGFHELRTDFRHGFEIEAEAGIGRDQDFDPFAQFASQDRALDVPAGEMCQFSRSANAGGRCSGRSGRSARLRMARRLSNQRTRVSGG